MNKIKKFMIAERVPAIVCTIACMASVLLGFVLGYMFFGPAAEHTLAADTVYQAEAPYLAVAELYEPSKAEYTLPAQDDKQKPSYLYIVTTLDGYIVVYYAEKNGGGIKEFTNTAVNALAPEEQNRLAAGIQVCSDEALARLLQDYGS